LFIFYFGFTLEHLIKNFFHSGKKRVMAITNSDNEDVFIPRYVFCINFYEPYFVLLTFISPVHDSPKKARFKEPSTPSKMVKDAGRQLVFDNAVYD
jgi:hypothetical protein